ncbi:hypothetical protein CR194_15790 [Salipaludibacillus keqinensis]|uniref:DUF3052 domain-containing protein n=1 Tax=Salipaludibacillus keqinensis TaxID=2045207 RepID=A0A323TF31_9BACI|nr:hypothetical protein [Salipaludibacillus keqinensis]PYZ92297.1 hypothetical protein CR194_15790 [Salipaludibacillus keqinensis]
MNPILKKMQYKEFKKVAVLNPPEEFQETLNELKKVTNVHEKPDPISKYEFVLIFVKSDEDLDKQANFIRDGLVEDGMLWFAYPKKSSKKYKVNIHRDKGWQAIQELGFEGVRQVAIDDDWSALRFRHVNFISSKRK